MTERIIAKAERTFPRIPDGWGNRGRTVVTVLASQLGGNRHPHFSVTCSIYGPRGRDLGGGCIHEWIRELWPEVEPVIRLHLANADDGEPMHAEGNGFYWLAGYGGGLGERYHGGNCSSSPKSRDECLAVLADHVRVPLDELRRIADRMIEGGTRIATDGGFWMDSPQGPILQKDKCIGHYVRKQFRDWVDSQRPRWRREAREGLELIRRLASPELGALAHQAAVEAALE